MPEKQPLNVCQELARGYHLLAILPTLLSLVISTLAVE